MTSTASPATDVLCAHALLLSTLLAAPVDEDTLDRVRDPGFALHWERATREARRGLALLVESAAAGEGIARIAADFARLFEGDECRVVPRESVYRPETDLEALAAIYSRAGFVVPEGLPLDHIATELRFAALLPVLAARPDREFPRFAHDHLRGWGSECLAEISLRAGSLFYQGVGTLGMDYVESLPTR